MMTHGAHRRADMRTHIYHKSPSLSSCLYAQCGPSFMLGQRDGNDDVMDTTATDVQIILMLEALNIHVLGYAILYICKLPWAGFGQ